MLVRWDVSATDRMGWKSSRAGVSVNVPSMKSGRSTVKLPLRAYLSANTRLCDDDQPVPDGMTTMMPRGESVGASAM